MSLRIFISHASNGDDASGVALADYRRFFCTAGIEPLDDSGLQAGEWRPELIKMMCECHAAVILLGRRASSSSAWVPAESFLFRARRIRQPDFRVFPVLLPDVTLAEIEGSAWLEPAALTDETVFKEDVLTRAGAQARILETLAPLRAKARQPPSLWSFASTVLQLIQDVEESSVIRAGTRLELDLEKWDPQRRKHAVLAGALLERAQCVAHLDMAIKAVEELPLDADTFARIANALLPLWIDETAAERMRTVVRRPATERKLELVSHYKFHDARRCTGDWLLKRARGAPDGWQPLNPLSDEKSGDQTGTSSEAMQLEENVRAQLIDRLGLDPEDDDGEIQDALAWWTSRNGGLEPVIVVLPRLDEALSSSLERLLTRFPGITLYILSRAASCLPSDPQHERIIVDSEAEKIAVRCHSAARLTAHQRARSSTLEGTKP